MTDMYILIPVVVLVVLFFLPFTSAKRHNCYAADEHDHDLVF
ncbi:hypothetical protein [Ilyomonas limi]|nr:hypothetical protein [Ilyomonas limi]